MQTIKVVYVLATLLQCFSCEHTSKYPVLVPHADWYQCPISNGVITIFSYTDSLSQVLTYCRLYKSISTHFEVSSLDALFVYRYIPILTSHGGRGNPEFPLLFLGGNVFHPTWVGCEQTCILFLLACWSWCIYWGPALSVFCWRELICFLFDHHNYLADVYFSHANGVVLESYATRRLSWYCSIKPRSKASTNMQNEIRDAVRMQT